MEKDDGEVSELSCHGYDGASLRVEHFEHGVVGGDDFSENSDTHERGQNDDEVDDDGGGVLHASPVSGCEIRKRAELSELT